MYLSKKYWEEHLKHTLLDKGDQIAHEIEFEDDDRFWLPMRRKVDDDFVGTGDVLCSLTLLPKGTAEKYPQGSGQQEPNSDPNVPPPEGRIKLSMNPIEMALQMVGPEFKAKMFTCLVCGACVALFVMMLPMIISNLITKAMVG